MAISLDLITGVLSFLFTLMILSYLIGDNPVFRLAVYMFIGITSGYIASIIWWQVLAPRLLMPLLPALLSGSIVEKVIAITPLLGAVFILMKLSPRLSKIASIAMAFLVGAGAAVIIAGALIGTIIPQISATINFFDPQLAAQRNINVIEVLGNGAIILVGVVTSLGYFHFSARQQANGTVRRFFLIEIIAFIGKIFIGTTLGVIFAGVYATALTAFIERISSLINFFGNF
ncbi:MAG: hypothetical protein UZ14_CFX002000781 [Chloroflexi bacterium OLB14]|nr:MAG: hypothetical protein UZ14_CFX002000781 [Chloroflexi bacterium OLB14]